MRAGPKGGRVCEKREESGLGKVGAGVVVWCVDSSGTRIRGRGWVGKVVA